MQLKSMQHLSQYTTTAATGRKVMKCSAKVLSNGPQWSVWGKRFGNHALENAACSQQRNDLNPSSAYVTITGSLKSLNSVVMRMGLIAFLQ